MIQFTAFAREGITVLAVHTERDGAIADGTASCDEPVHSFRHKHAEFSVDVASVVLDDFTCEPDSARALRVWSGAMSGNPANVSS